MIIWWTIARVLWSLVVLTTIMQGWLTHAAHRDRPLYSLVLVGLFLVTELIPYFAALDQNLLALIATDSGGGGSSQARVGGGGHSQAGSRYGALQQGGLTPVSDSGASVGADGGYGPPEVVGVTDGEGEGEALYGDAVEEDEEEGKVAGVGVGVGVRR